MFANAEPGLSCFNQLFDSSEVDLLIVKKGSWYWENPIIYPLMWSVQSMEFSIELTYSTEMIHVYKIEYHQHLKKQENMQNWSDHVGGKEVNGPEDSQLFVNSFPQNIRLITMRIISSVVILSL